LNKNITIGSKKPLVENLLVIEGISRSGKFLLSNVIAGIKDVEPVQYSAMLEQVPFLIGEKLMNKEAAKELIRCEIDLRCYETLIGRNLNQRSSDKSSIYNNPNYKNLLRRTKDLNTNGLVEKFIKEKRYAHFILHESASQMSLFLEMFPKIKWINLQRKPIDLAYSWYKRGLGRRWGKDPLLFQIPFSNGKENTFPWFVLGHEKNYVKLNEMDRVILSLKLVIKKNKKIQENLSQDNRTNILIVNFEQLLADPRSVVQEICKFLKRPALKEMSKILRREDLPQIRAENEQIKLNEIRKVASNKYFKELLDLNH